MPQIEVTFDIDANGIVNVSAKDLGTGKEQHITITSSTNMSKEDMEKAVKEAEQYAAEDKKKREEVDIRNDADQMVFQTEKAMGEFGDKVSASEKTEVNAKLERAEGSAEGQRYRGHQGEAGGPAEGVLRHQREGLSRTRRRPGRPPARRAPAPTWAASPRAAATAATTTSWTPSTRKCKHPRRVRGRGTAVQSGCPKPLLRGRGFTMRRASVTIWELNGRPRVQPRTADQDGPPRAHF